MNEQLPALDMATDPRLDAFCAELERLAAREADVLSEMSEDSRDLYETHLIRVARRTVGLPVYGVRVPLLARLAM